MDSDPNNQNPEILRFTYGPRSDSHIGGIIVCLLLLLPIVLFMGLGNMGLFGGFVMMFLLILIAYSLYRGLRTEVPNAGELKELLLQKDKLILPLYNEKTATLHEISLNSVQAIKLYYHWPDQEASIQEEPCFTGIELELANGKKFKITAKEFNSKRSFNLLFANLELHPFLAHLWPPVVKPSLFA
jgi:hypothetical protein